MLEDPGLEPGELASSLRTGYGVEALGFRFVRGHDMRAASYDVAATRGRFFLKVLFRPAATAPLEVPRALLDAGISEVVAPIRTLTSALWHPMADGGGHLVLYPFVVGQNAVVAGMTATQWRAFGRTLRAVHDSGLAERFGDRLPAETFRLASAAVVRRSLEMALRPSVDSVAQRRLRACLEAQTGRIGAILARAEALGAMLARRPFVHVLCHADIHAANLLVADDGRILLVDWDGPLRAPRERDLLFVIGSRNARTVKPHEEAWFFEGYGAVDVDRDALVYYRYERILEDLGEIATGVFSDPARSGAMGEWEVRLVESLFGPGGDVEAAEIV